MHVENTHQCHKTCHESVKKDLHLQTTNNTNISNNENGIKTSPSHKTFNLNNITAVHTFNRNYFNNSSDSSVKSPSVEQRQRREQMLSSQLKYRAQNSHQLHSLSTVSNCFTICLRRPYICLTILSSFAWFG